MKAFIPNNKINDKYLLKINNVAIAMNKDYFNIILDKLNKIIVY